MRLAFQLPAAEASTREARDLVSQRFGDLIPAIALYDLLTVVSELVTNAVRHGEGEHIDIGVEVDEDGRVTGEVRNDGAGAIRRLPIDLDLDQGLGLHMVDVLTAGWSVEGDGFTRVLFELRPV